MSQRREDQALSIGRLYRLLNEARVNRALVDSRFELQFRAKIEGDMRLKRYYRGFSAQDLYAMDFATVTDHDLLPIRRECVARQDVARGAGFLIVSLDWILQPAILSRAEIPNVEPRLGIEPCTVDELVAVG